MSKLFFLKIYCLPLSTQTTVEALDDEALFRIDEDEEEDGAFVMYVDIFALLSDLLLNYHVSQGQLCRCTGRRFLGSPGVRYRRRVWHVKLEHPQEAPERQEQGGKQTFGRCVRIDGTL